MVQQVTLRWSAAGAAGGQTAMFFQDSASPAAIATDVNAFVAALRPALASTTSVTPDTDIRQYDSTTGALTGLVAFPTPTTVAGTGGATAVPNAAQGLIRLRSNTIVNGRFLAGRIYVPGMSQTTMQATGEVSSTGLTPLNAAGAVLAASINYQIWHRPVNGGGGNAAVANQSSAWNEFAVQRRRRS